MSKSLLVVTLLALVATAVVAAPGFANYKDYAGKPYKVDYSARAINIGGQPSLFVSGSIHYPRSTPALWPLLMKRALASGLNMIEVYVFWNYHERVEGVQDWSGRGNLTQFLQFAADAGLFVNLRIGPYVCAEWDYGGIPAWLAYKDNMKFRSYNANWRNAMAAWVTTVVKQTRNYFADMGGPIILAQIENELPSGDTQYTQWCGDLANSYGIGIVWGMCNGQTANNTINTCNANDCTGYIENHGQNGRILIDQPAVWTENEEWFQTWGDENVFAPNENPGFFRSPQDQAFSVARWYARGGSSMNYYMFHGGNHYDRTAGSGLTNAYANYANLHSDGFPNEPKHSHLTRLHRTVATLAEIIVNNPADLAGKAVPYSVGNPGNWSTGTQQIVFTYGTVAFLESSASIDLYVLYMDTVYYMPSNSIFILYKGSVIFNSSLVIDALDTRTYTPVSSSFSWSNAYVEPTFVGTTSSGLPPITNSTTPLEQISVTLDMTEFMWYSTTITLSQSINNPVVSIAGNSANSYFVFINGKTYGGNTYDKGHTGNTKTHTITLAGTFNAGKYTISIMSGSLGIDNGMGTDSVPYDGHEKGIVGKVSIGGVDITSEGWVMRPYLLGEWLQVYTVAGSKKVNWDSPINEPLSWVQSSFAPITVPYGSQVMFNATGLTRGHVFINGMDIGRYWTIEGGSTGQPTQILYHVPSDWLMAQNNIITIFEEIMITDITLPHFVVVTADDSVDNSNVADM